MRPFSLKNNSITYEKIGSEGFLKRSIVTYNKLCSNQKTALIFRDSYFTALIPYLSLHFEKVIYIWDHKINMDIVDREKPDVVMSLCVERYLNRLLK